MNKAENVSVGKPKATGAAYVAPKGTVVPTDAASPLDAAFESLGYISDAGLTNATSSDTEEIKAWGGDTVLTTQTSYSETFAFSCLETNIAVLKERYGEENVEVDGASITVKHSSVELLMHPWVFEMVLSGGRIKRVVIPNGKVTEFGDIQYVDNAPIAYEMTISALPDEEGNTAYTHIGETGFIRTGSE